MHACDVAAFSVVFHTLITVKHSFYELGLIDLFRSTYIMFKHESHASELFFDATYVVTRGTGTRKRERPEKFRPFSLRHK